MNKITYAILIILLSRISFAEYNVFIPLDPNKIIIKDAQVNGEIKLKNATIRRGEQTSIIWDYKYANKIEIDNIGSYTTKKGDVGISPVETTEYLANISNGENNKQEKLTLTVIQPQQQITFTSDIQKIGFGQHATLNWNIIDAESASIDNGIGGVSFNSNTTVYPQTSTTYTLTAKGYTGISDKSKSLSIEVVPDTIISSFNVDKEKLTIGDTATFNWNVSNSELLKFNGTEVNKPSGIKEVVTTTIGDFDYTLESTSFSGLKSNEKRTISVYPEPKVNSFTVNDVATNIKVSPNDSLNFNWTSSGFSEQLLDNVLVTGQSKILTAPVSGSKDYVYVSRNGAGKEAQNKITVSVIQPVTITGVTAPNNVFEDSAFTMSWTATNAMNYKIKSNNTASGIATTDVDLDIDTSVSITPTAVGTYTYTLTATNDAGVTTTSTKQVVVEALPTFTGFTVNGLSTVTVSPSAALSFLGTGYSSGATLQGRNSAGNANSTLPTTASATAGSTTYYASAMKTVNGITNYSAVRTVSVTVVNAPSITSMTAPTTVFEDSAFTMSWVGTSATNYKIKSNNASSGISTTDVDLNTSTTTSITPTAAGTYTYTLTATNAAGVTATSTKQVVVEAFPTFTGFTVNGTSTVTVAPSAALSFLGTGYSSGASLQGRNSAGNANATLPTTASGTAGTTTYYAAAMKTINGVTNYSAVRSVSVVVVNAPSITSITAPTSVFMNSAFTMSWAASNAISYSIKSNNASSGIATTDVDLATNTSVNITPTAAGTYIYTLTATNAAGVTTTSTKQIVVESLPTFTGFTVNGAASINVAPSATLDFVGTGFSTGATLQGRNSAGTANATLPNTASAMAGTTTYYAAATKTLNGVTNNSAVRSVSITVVNAPVISATSAPSPVFMNSSFTMSWSGTDVSNYTIKSDNAASGIATTDVGLGTSTSRAITPTAAGNYVYTITATNSAGVRSSRTVSVVVEIDPSFTGFTVNGAASASVVQSTAITFAGSGYSNGATLQGMNSAGTAESNLPSTASSAVTTTTYYASAKKVLNGISRYSPVKSVTVTTRSSIVCPAYGNYSNGVVYNTSNRRQDWYYGGARVATTTATSVATGGYTYTRSTYVGSAIIDEVGNSEEMYRICRQ